jgi:hypothetical protein
MKNALAARSAKRQATAASNASDTLRTPTGMCRCSSEQLEAAAQAMLEHG